MNLAKYLGKTYCVRNYKLKKLTDIGNLEIIGALKTQSTCTTHVQAIILFAIKFYTSARNPLSGLIGNFFTLRSVL